MATIIINSTMEDCLMITAAIDELRETLDAKNITLPMSIKSVCEVAQINANKGRFMIEDCVAHGLIEKTLLVDKNARYKRYIYSVTEKGKTALKEGKF